MTGIEWRVRSNGDDRKGTEVAGTYVGRDSNYVGFHYFFAYVQEVQERKTPFISQILRQFAPLPSFSQLGSHATGGWRTLAVICERI